MKNFNIDLSKIKLPKKKKKFKKEISFRINRNTFWIFLVFLFFIIIIVGVVFNYFLFKQFIKSTIVEVDNPVSSKDLNIKQEIDNINLIFKNKEKKSKEIINSNNIIIDPSL